MKAQYTEIHRHLTENFGKGPFSRESAERIAFDCGQVSEIINELIQDGHVEVRDRGQLALAGA